MVLKVLSATKRQEGSLGSGRMTAVTIAGERDSKGALAAYLDFFKRNADVIIELFADTDKNRIGEPGAKVGALNQKSSEYMPMKEKIDMKKKIELRYFSVEDASDQLYYAAELFYWGTLVGDIEIVNLFFVHLGFSPFINLFKGQSPVHASALALNYELFHYFIKDSCHGLPQ